MRTYLIMLAAACCLSIAGMAQAPYPAAPAPAGNLVKAEYFFDTDPGIGNATAVAITPAVNVNNFSASIVINGTGLTQGFHRLYIRTQDVSGRWSLTNNALFDNYVVPLYTAAPAVVNLQEAEYFIDTDPGAGMGTKIPLTTVTDISNLNALIDITGLAKSVHHLFIRTKDAAGKWSITNQVAFDNTAQTPYPTAPPAPATLSMAEYFIDTDPGIGMGTRIPLTATTNVSNVNAVVSLNGVTPAAHWLYIRTMDASGKWSITNQVMFENTAQAPYPTAPAAAPPIGTVEYFIDTDPGFGNGTPVTVPNQSDVSGLSINIPVNGLSEGPHTLYIRSKQNPWSFNAYAEFSVGSILPVTWSYVKGELINDGALISWVTAQESNTKGFIVEHSTDGVRYTAVGTVAAAGTSEVPVSYRFKHNSPSKGINYYRIRQTDLDGEFTVSKVIPLLNNNNLRETIVAPNPVKDMVHIIEPAAVVVRKVEVYDIKGRLVLTEPVGGQSRQVISLSLNTLKTGHYTIKVSYENKVRSFQVIKQ